MRCVNTKIYDHDRVIKDEKSCNALNSFLFPMLVQSTTCRKYSTFNCTLEVNSIRQPRHNKKLKTLTCINNGNHNDIQL